MVFTSRINANPEVIDALEKSLIKLSSCVDQVMLTMEASVKDDYLHPVMWFITDKNVYEFTTVKKAISIVKKWIKNYEIMDPDLTLNFYTTSCDTGELLLVLTERIEK